MNSLTRRALTSFPLPPPDAEDKNDRGRVFAIAGSLRCPGAALLCAEAAMRGGAGKVQLGLPRSLAVAAGLALPECGLVPLEQSEAGESLAAPLSRLEDAVGAADACVIGPGLADAEAAHAMAAAVMRCRGSPALVLDALALAELAAAQGGPHQAHTVLTPNHDELARLLDIPKTAVRAEPERHALAAAQRFSSLVIAKADITDIVTPDGTHWRHQAGAPGLAASGSGDVLAGLLAGLLAQGADPLTAALWSVEVHAEAGRLLASRSGAIGYRASELLPLLPGLLRGGS